MLWDADEGKSGLAEEASFPSLPEPFPAGIFPSPHSPLSGLPLESAERIGTKPGNSREKSPKRRILNRPGFPKPSRERSGRAGAAGRRHRRVPSAVPKPIPWEFTLIPPLRENLAAQNREILPENPSWKEFRPPRGGRVPSPHPGGSGIIAFHAELRLD